MPEQTRRSLNHFGFVAFTDAFFALDSSDRRDIADRLLTDWRHVGEHFEVYPLAPGAHLADFLIWSVVTAENTSAAHQFFTRAANVQAAHRRWLKPTGALWGFTKPSQYTKSRSTQELDPFAGERKPYLVIYPFTKTAEWYRLSREARQGMMNEHIRLGKEFPEISQLLLYSFGVQDQEFVVVYEMEDLSQFSDLVYALRDTEARRYTKSDAPLYTAIHHPPEQTLDLWCAPAGDNS
ncbi:MAG: chlorite dismutase family protein [Chloroflexi bacterium]|nr:chlorite dismutase family protein [Chloroflexota bacterium]